MRIAQLLSGFSGCLCKFSQQKGRMLINIHRATLCMSHRGGMRGSSLYGQPDAVGSVCPPLPLYLHGTVSKSNRMVREPQIKVGLRRQPYLLHVPLLLVIKSSNALQKLKGQGLQKHRAPNTSERTCSSQDAFPGKQLTFVILTLSYTYFFKRTEFFMEN